MKVLEDGTFAFNIKETRLIKRLAKRDRVTPVEAVKIALRESLERAMAASNEGEQPLNNAKR